MNTIAKQFLTAAIKIIIGSARWVKVKDAVVNISTSNLKGKEKQALVIAELKNAGVELANSLLNLAIEIAVATLTKTAVDFVNKK